MAKVLFVLTSHDRLGDTGEPTGFYVPEAAHPYAELRTAQIDVDLASIRGGAPPAIGYDPADEAQRRFVEDPAIADALANSTRLADVDADGYDGVLFVGGHGTMWDFPEDVDVQRIIREVYESGRIVAAVCHGPAALVNVRLSDGSYLVAGKTVAGFTDAEEVAAGLDEVVPFPLATDARRARRHHTAGASFEPHVEVDGRLITGQNPASAQPLGRALATALAAQAPATA
jgi:putative intracellular protease/amidase